MTDRNRVSEHFRKYIVTYLFIALSSLFIVVSGLDMNYVASQLLLRLNRNAFIVLALIIPICGRFIRQFRAEILEQLGKPYGHSFSA